MRHLWMLTLAGGAPLLGIALSVQADGPEPVQVGNYVPIEVATPREYAGRAGWPEPGRAWTHVLHHVDATYIAIHFVDFHLAAGDVLTIADGQGGQAYTLTGRGKMSAGTFWARHVKGDTAVLTLSVASETGGAGFEIDQYAAGFVELTPFGPQAPAAICGPDDRENAICYQDSHPVEYGHARAVARLLIEGRGACTGSLVSPFDHVLTNNHCIPSPEEAINVDFDFGAEAPTCDTPNCRLCFPGQVFSGSRMVETNTGTDYSLVQIEHGHPSATYGYLEIDDRVPVIGEQIYNAQHAGAEAKMLAIFSSHPADAGGVNRIFSLTEPTCLAASGIDEVGYYMDGFGGSSGSPVIATATHKLIALHHCGGCPNRGIAAHMIYPEIEEHVTGLAPLGGIARGSLSVSASSQASGQGPDRAIDGELNTQWQSSGGGPHWLQLDLGGLAAVTSFTVYHASSGGGPSTQNTRWFEIQSAPAAGGPWSTEFAGSNPGQAPTNTFACDPPRPLRHVRLRITDAGVDGVARIRQFEVAAAPGMFDALPPGVNVAGQSISVQASSAFSPELDGDKAVDGVLSLSSRWVSAAVAPPQTLTLDLGTTRRLSGFILRQAANVESPGYNADAFSFQTARSLSGPWYSEARVLVLVNGLYDARRFVSPKEARYVRLSIADPGPKNDPIARVPEFEVIQASGPLAGFVATPASGPSPLTVQFTDLSTDSPTSWNWDFGDGGNSDEQHPSHTYSTPGQYTVSLSVNGPAGPASVTRASYVDVQATAADFVGVPTDGVVPLTVDFTDLSTGVVTAWSWSFGDGGMSDEQHPSHTYTTPGTFSVSLSVSGPAGDDIETKVGYIQVTSPGSFRGDFDYDGDLDLDDVGRMQRCLSGPGVEQADPSCAKAHFDTDGDVDQDDVGPFLNCLSGAGVPADPACAE